MGSLNSLNHGKSSTSIHCLDQALSLRQHSSEKILNKQEKLGVSFCHVSCWFEGTQHQLEMRASRVIAYAPARYVDVRLQR